MSLYKVGQKVRLIDDYKQSIKSHTWIKLAFEKDYLEICEIIPGENIIFYKLKDSDGKLFSDRDLIPLPIGPLLLKDFLEEE